MKVYCSHLNNTFHKKSNYIVCNLCPARWYTTDPTPMVIIGFTEQYEVDKDYMERWAEKDLSQKVFTRCRVCKDLLGKRKHLLCMFKTSTKSFVVRHREFIQNITIVIKGFKKDQ